MIASGYLQKIINDFNPFFEKKEWLRAEGGVLSFAKKHYFQSATIPNFQCARLTLEQACALTQ